LKRREDGQVVAMFAIVLTLLIGVSALVVDIGMKYSYERAYQALADSASLAGAQELQPVNRASVPTPTMQSKARAEALRIVLTHLTGSTSDPSCDPASDIDCVVASGRYRIVIMTPSLHCVDCDVNQSIQVRVEEPNFSTTFARLFGQTTWNLNRTSVAGLSFGHSYAIVALRPVKPRSGAADEVRDIRLDGGTQVYVTTGDVGTNSNMDYASCSSLLHLDAGYRMFNVDTPPEWCAAPLSHPIGTLIADPGYPIPPAPATIYNSLLLARDTAANCAALVAAKITPTTNYGPLVPSGPPGSINCYRPGTYNALLADGNGDLTILEPGLYYFTQGVDIQGSIIGGYDPTELGVTLWFPRDQQFKQRNGAVALNAGSKFKNVAGVEPATAPAMTGGTPNLKMTVIVQPNPACPVVLPYPTACHDPGSGGGSASNQTIDLAGGAGIYLGGVQYAPSDNMTITGNSSSAVYVGQVWSWTIYYKGNNTVINQEGSSSDGPGNIRIDTACSPSLPVCYP
jgi:hypothetical protein